MLPKMIEDWSGTTLKRPLVVGVLVLITASCSFPESGATTTTVEADTTTSTSVPPVETTLPPLSTSTAPATPPELSVDTVLSGPDAAWHSVAVEVPNITVSGFVTPESTVTLLATHPPVDGEVVSESEATVENDYFYGEVVLAPGRNTVAVIATGPSGTSEVTLDARYEPEATIEFGFLNQVSASEIVADYAQWLTGEEANQAAFEDGEIPSVEEGVPNDYYIRNVNPRLRTLPHDDDVRIWLTTSAEGSVTTIEVGLEEWLTIFNDGNPWDYETDEVPPGEAPHFGYLGAGTVYAPYWLIILDEAVIAIEQQYIP